MRQECTQEGTSVGAVDVAGWASLLGRTLLVALTVLLISSTAIGGFASVTTPSDQGPQEIGIGAVSAQSSSTSENDSISGGTVVFQNQTTQTGQNVTVRSVTLPEGGFVAIHGSDYTAGIVDNSLITTSSYLSPSEHENVTIPIEAGVPGKYENESKLNGTEELTARLYTDSNDNQHFDYILSSDDDSAYRNESGSGSVADTSEVVVSGTRGSPSWEVPTASVDFQDQTTRGKTVTVNRAKLPSGGFLVVHDSTYLAPENDTFGSIIGVSRYVPPNQNVSQVDVELYNVPGRSMNQSRLRSNTTLVVEASRDTNSNQEYDFYSSNGTNDTGYTNGSQSVIQPASITLNTAGSASQLPPTTEATGQPVSIGPNPNKGVLGQISGLFEEPLFTVFVGGAFILFVIAFAIQVGD